MDENYVQLRDLYIQEQLGELELTPEQREAEFQRIRLLDDDGVRDALEELAGEGEEDEGEDEFDPLEYVASNPDLIAASAGRTTQRRPRPSITSSTASPRAAPTRVERTRKDLMKKDPMTEPLMVRGPKVSYSRVRCLLGQLF